MIEYLIDANVEWIDLDKLDSDAALLLNLILKEMIFFNEDGATDNLENLLALNEQSLSAETRRELGKERKLRSRSRSLSPPRSLDPHRSSSNSSASIVLSPRYLTSNDGSHCQILGTVQ